MTFQTFRQWLMSYSPLEDGRGNLVGYRPTSLFTAALPAALMQSWPLSPGLLPPPLDDVTGPPHHASAGLATAAVSCAMP